MKKKSAPKLTPTPTEYAGVVFRSKTEAMFAWSLDQVDCIWVYEPVSFRVAIADRMLLEDKSLSIEGAGKKCVAITKGYVPDFEVCFRTGVGLERIWIELKPKQVTRTYAEKTEKLLRMACSPNAYGVIVVGSPYDSQDRFNVAFVGRNGAFQASESSPALQFISATAAQYLRHSKNHRFDLAA